MTATATADITTAGKRPRAVYTRIEALGLALIALVPVVFVAAVVITGGSTDELAFFALPFAIATIGALLVWRFGTWAKVVGVVLSLAAALTMFWAAFGLAYPSSFADFVPGLMLPLGVVLGVGGGIAAVVRRRRMEVEATAGERRLIRFSIGLLVLAALVSATMHLVSKTTADAAGAAATATMSDFEFTPATYEVASGDSILVHNSDAFVHTFTVPELGIDQTVVPGSRHLIEVTGDAGTYTVYCRPHADMDEAKAEDAGMAASLTVR